MFHIICYLLLLFLSLCCNAHKPIALVHVGPHKAGSTYVQSLLLLLESSLQEEGIKVIKNEEYTSDIFSPDSNLVYLGKSLMDAGKANENVLLRSAHRVLSDHLHNNRSVILSAEIFDSQSINLGVFVRLLSHFRVTIAIVHRNWLSMLISTYFQECRMLRGVIKRCRNIPESKEVSFENFVVYNNLTSSVSVLAMERQALSVANRYANHFGANNIRILDLEGLVSGGSDIFLAFLDLLNPSEKLKQTAVSTVQSVDASNVGYSMDYNQIFRAATSKGLVPPECNMVGQPSWEAWSEIPDNERREFPKKCTRQEILDVLVRQALRLDTSIREMWAQSIVGGSRVAAEEAIQKAQNDVRLCAVDEKAFFSSKYWVNLVKEEIRRKCTD